MTNIADSLLHIFVCIYNMYVLGTQHKDRGKSVKFMRHMTCLTCSTFQQLLHSVLFYLSCKFILIVKNSVPKIAT